MGWLDNSTNNILLDAVLTDLGRQLLARNDGSFSISKFALGDDEVDYTMIQRYGRTVGKEKIEKNTPVFEGLTNQGFALKHKLISVSNPNLVYLPTLKLASTSNSSTIALNRNMTSTTVLLEQSIESSQSIDVELADQLYQVEMNNLFLQISNATPDFVDNQQRATYVRQSTQAASAGGTQLSFGLRIKSITDSQFAVYGQGTNKSIIVTYVRVTGKQSGAVKEFAVTIEK